MLKLRIRLMEDNGTKSSKSRVVKTESITVTHILNEAPRLTFQASRADMGNVNTPFVVGVEYSTGGAFKPLPEHNLFIVEQDSDDSLNPAKIVTYECQGFVPWLLSGALHHWHRTAKDGKRTWVEPGRTTASAGWVLNGMFTDSKNGGWYPALQKDFNGSTDSAGKSWTNSDRVEQAWELDKNTFQIMEQMTLDGLIDWSSSGTTWRVFRADTYGTDRAHLVLGGTGFESVPVKVDASSLYSHIRAIPDGLPWQNFTSDTSIRSRFGHRSVILQQSGVKSAATSAKLAQPHIQAGKEVMREESYNWTPRVEKDGTRGICPWADFKLGDHVTARARGGKQVRRVVGIIAEQTGDVTNVQTRVGEKIGSAGSRLARRLESVAVGGIIGGSGSAFPSTPPPLLTPPGRVNGLVLVSNVGEWSPDWTAKSVIEISWAPVTDNVDGSESAIESYEVWIRRPDTELRYLTTTTDTSLTIDSITPGETVLIAVRAMSDSRRYGEFSLELLVTAATPKSMVPNKVTGLALQSQVAAFTPTGPRATLNLKWAAVTKSVEDVDISVDVYRVWVNGALHAEVESLSTSVVIPSQVSTEIRISAVADDLESDRSEPLVVTGDLPAVFELEPTAPVLSSSHGNVRAVWNGLYTTAAPAGAHTVRVEARVGSGAWITQGSALTGAGEQLVSVGEIGDTVEVRLRAFDQLGRLTGTSASASIEVQGVGLSDLNEAVNDYLSDIETTALEAHQSADGKNTIHYGNTAPAGTDHIVGDTWFDGANGNRVHRWDGSNWTAAQFGSNAIANLAITNAEIANGTIQNGKIANLDAAKINAGTLNAARIGANTIGAEKLMVADLSNMATVSESVPGTAAYANWTSTVVDGWAARSAITDTYFMFRKQHGPLPFKTGDRIRVTFEAYADAAVNATLTLWTYPAGTGSSNTFPGGNIALTTTPQLFERELTVTAPTEGKNAFLIGLSGVSNRDVRLRNVRAYRMGAGELIVDGAVRAEHIEMDQGFAEKFEASEALFGTIGVDQLKPNIGELISIEGNVVITGLLDPEDGKLAEMEAATSAVSNAVDSVGAIAERADGKALSAYGLAEGVQTALTNHRKVFRVTNGVPEVATLNGLNVLRLEPDRIEMEQGGQIVTYWSNGELVVSNIMASHVKIVNPSNSQGHVIEHDGASGVIINPL